MFQFFRKNRSPRSPWDLQTPLLSWSKDDPWTIGSSVEGTVIFGSTGSGKTSGSGALLAKSMLSAGYGGLVLTCKKDELNLWHSYARATNRLDDLLVLGSGEPLRFNFLDYEATRAGAGAGHVENVASLLMLATEIADRMGPGSGTRDSEPFWRRSTLQLIRNFCDLSLMATSRISIPVLHELVTTAPLSPEQALSEGWAKNSACCHALDAAHRRVSCPERRKDLHLVSNYILREYAGLASRTRSIIVSSFSGITDTLNRGLLRSLLCTTTNFTPEMLADGRILVVNLPLKEFGEIGAIAQGILKLCFQRAMERRDVAQNPRPVVLWSDEFQNLVSSNDAMFQATARSSRVASVYITQNLPGIHAALGGAEQGKARAAALLSNCLTKVFHCNADPETNEWASTLIGRSLQTFSQSSSSFGAQDWAAQALGAPTLGQSTAGFSEQYEFTLQPVSFSLLRTGGRDNGMLVDAIVYQNGRRFRATGENYIHTTFEQMP